jgi:hypothetical protein
MSVVYNRCLLGLLSAKKENEREKVVLFRCILLAMATTERRANARVYVSKNAQQCNYPRGALIMVAGAGGGNF